MKNIFRTVIIGAAAAISATSCTNLDLYPLDAGSSETWFKSPAEYRMAANDMYRHDWWPLAKEAWSDDYLYRKVAGPDIVDGTLNSETNTAGSVELELIWTNNYKAIGRANSLINNVSRGEAAGINKEELLGYEAQARFTRACHYGALVFHFGDVVYMDRELLLEECYNKTRTPKAEIIQKMYEDFDFAIANLKNPQGKQVFTKGAALAMKARYALYFGDYEIAAKAAKECMDLGVYQLYPDYAELFHVRNNSELIFCLPASSTLGIGNIGDSKSYINRLNGGMASKCPSWAIFATYECTDGKTIDQSPLFDGKNPFANRDPRCAASIAEFGSNYLGFEYNPRPSATKVMDFVNNKQVTNKDNYPIGNANASYSGLLWRKRVEESWIAAQTDNDKVIIRLADVMLMYAEAMIELNQIDDTVLSAINQVRARAYGVKEGETDKYPAITTTDQTELRKVVRRERRVELAFEGLRYYDLIRWRIAEKALNMPNCGLLSDKTKAKAIETKGYWFWSITPTFDEDGIPSFQALINAERCEVHSTGSFTPKMYLWPIPYKEIMANPNITQNEGY